MANTKLNYQEIEVVKGALLDLYGQALNYDNIASIYERDKNRLKDAMSELENAVDCDLACLGRIIQDVHFAQRARKEIALDFDLSDDLDPERFKHITNLLGRLSDLLWKLKTFYNNGRFTE